MLEPRRPGGANIGLPKAPSAIKLARGLLPCQDR